MNLRRLSITLLFVSSASLADEGMWTFDNLPLEQMERKFGFTPSTQWIDRVRQSAAALGGCSSSFVSATGLVLTNHHCAVGCLQQISTAGKNYRKDGFLARKPEEELQCPAQEVSTLEQISDVTEQVNLATRGLTGEPYKNALNAVSAKLTSQCVGAEAAKKRCSLVSLYQGGQYHLYRYHRYTDVRLVWAPEAAAGEFGGDPDNFNFPRYPLDATILRAYEQGKPAVIANHLVWSQQGPQSGELIFTVGGPGRTERLLTVAQLEYERDTTLIETLRSGYEFRGLLTQFRKSGPEQARVAANDLFFLENYLKSSSGKLTALQSSELLNRKREEEAALRKFVADHPALCTLACDAWDQIARAQGVAKELGTEFGMLEGGRAFQSTYFSLARTLVRGAVERGKPDGERLPEFTATRLAMIERRLAIPTPINNEFEKVKLEWSLTKFRERLGADDPLVLRVLGKESPAQLANRLIDGTGLGDMAQRKAIWAGGLDAVNQSQDPFIVLARAIDDVSRALRKRFETEVGAVQQKNSEAIAKARFQFLGTKVYPDATGTLRLSFGAVKSWHERGKPVAEFTDFAGAFKRHSGAEPYALPASWLDARERLNLSETLNFVATTDIIGGNSGSPMLNKKAELVGLAFDGNIHSLGGAFWFDPANNRSIGVTSTGILETLRKIYRADELVTELLAP